MRDYNEFDDRIIPDELMGEFADDYNNDEDEYYRDLSEPEYYPEEEVIEPSFYLTESKLCEMIKKSIIKSLKNKKR